MARGTVPLLLPVIVPCAALAAALAAAAPAAHAQSATATLRGSVRDSAGGPLADAQIQAVNAASGVRRGTLTNASGSYNIGGLQPGTYTVRVLRIGFAPQEQSVRLPVGEVVTRDFRVGAAAVQQLAAVRVTGAPRALDRTTSEVASNVSTEQIENLPQNNRNFLDFAALAPGVQRRESGVSAGGQSVNQANLFIDGASYKSDLLRGGIAGQDPGFATRNLRGVGNVSGNPFPQNAVQEFRVVTQNFKAEYQRATGAVITAATKSGTNTVTGDLFFYGQNRNLLATNYWDQVDQIERPDYGRAQFGGSVGGPIVRDKFHYFASYEGTFVDLNSRVTFRTPPALLAQVPDSLRAGLNAQYDTPLRNNLFFGKLDYALSDAQSLIFTANVRRDTDTRGVGGNTAIEGENNVRQQIDSYLLRHTLNAGAISNEAQLGWQRQGISNRGTGDAPRLDYRDYQIVRGSFPSIQDFTQDRFTLRNDVQWSLGTHVLKGGAIVEHLRYDIDKRNSEIPVFSFNPVGVGAPAGLGINVPYQATLQIGNGIVKENNTQFGLYAQDDWTIANRLTLNLGVRWDVETNALNNDFRTPQVIRDSIGRFLQTNPFFDGERYFNDGSSDRKVFLGAVQPRLGFSYDLTGNGATTLYGGAGVFYDRVFQDILLDERLRTQRPQYNFFFRRPGDPANPNTIAFTPSLYNREALVALINAGQQVRPEAFLIPDDLRPPRSNHFNLGVRQQLADGRYQLSATGTLVNGYNGFRYVWGQRDIRPGTTYGSFRPVPGFSAILRATDEGRSWYRALLFQASKPLGGDARWGGDLSYTLSKSETNTVNDDDPFALDYVSEAEFRRNPSRFDERHRVALNLIGRGPWGIRASTLTQLGSGFPYNVSTNCDATQAQLATQLAANPGDQRLQFCQTNGYFGNGNGPDFDDNPPGQRLWSGAPEGKWFGPFGKWAFRQVDLRLQKDVTVRTGQVASVFFDVYNVFNFDNFNYYDFRYGLYNDRDRQPLPFSTFDSRRAQLGVRYGFGAR
jgi:hypothetical protein